MVTMKETLMKWVGRAEPVLSDLNVTCYLTGGNEDHTKLIVSLFVEKSAPQLPVEG
jgi:hypothetical protein